MSLKGKTAIITGAGQGIGKNIAEVLAKAGANIVVSDISIDNARSTAKELESFDVETYASACDVSDFNQVEEMVKSSIEKFGKIDILVNNAGITKDNLMLRMKKEDWDAVINVNLTGIFNCTKLVSKYMIKQKIGKIVNITSVVGAMGNAGQVNYSASKAGVIGFTKSAARELAVRNISVNAVAPGFIDTDMTRVLPDNVKESLLLNIPAKKFGMPEDISNCVKFLVSDDATYITGQVIHVNGGMYM